MSRRPRFRLRLTGRGKARLGAHREARSHDARPSEQGGTPARSALAGAESQPGSSAAVKVEEELRARNEFIQTILDNLPIGLAVHNIEDGTASYGNAKFLEIYGWTEADVTNVESFFEHVYPDPAYREKIQTRVMLDMASGDPEAMCWSGMEATRKDGSKRIIEARNIPLFEQGLMISTVTDITEKTRQQEKILQLERQVHLAQRLESVGRLAGGIAHDFNNLLTVVSSYAELALGSLSEGDPLRADLAQILEAADRGSRLTKHLLAISRRQVLEPKIIDLNAILDSLNPMLRRLIGEDIELQTVKAQGLGFVRADPAQLEQVVLNLIVNARDAMPRGGRVTIETANVTLGEDYASIHPETAPGPHVMLAVSDTGVGMTPEVREKIFEPFFTTKEVGQGSGLGLATVYGIVKQTGGSIWVYSEPGLGTTFKVYLPQILGEVAASEETLPSRKIRGTETILVVEDEAEVRELARRILESAGYRVTVAANAGEALAEAERIGASFQLLLTDVVMPKMNGKELSERLCRLCPSLKVLFTSGYPDNAIAHHGVLEPGTEYLAKPFGPQDLLRRVREVLDSPAPKRTGL